MKFYIGISSVSMAWAFPRVMISIAAIANRWQDFHVNNWIMDSGGFKQIMANGRFDLSPRGYAVAINHWKSCGKLVGAVAQDWMCDPVVRHRTGKTVEEHQELTIKNYVDLLPRVNGVRVIPVLQGYRSREYVAHLKGYGNLLKKGEWVAVGSIVNRSNDPVQIQRILEGIKSERPDLNLHGFGLKTMSLKNQAIKNMLYSSDSIAWIVDARYDSWDKYRENRIKNGEVHENGKLMYGVRDPEATAISRGCYDPRVALKYAIQMQRTLGEDELIKWWDTI